MTIPNTPIPNDQRIAQLATIVDQAAQENKPITQLTQNYPKLSLHEAYSIQRASMARRFKRGERLVGMKMGLTSLAKMKQVGVHEPIYGHLTDQMLLSDGGTLYTSKQIHPRVEPEIAFLLKRDIRGPVSPAQAMLAVDGICAALEVIDSRYERFKFAISDVVADNASSSKFILGSHVVSPSHFDISNVGMIMEINGEAKQIGSSAAIFEHPANSLAKLANMLAERGEYLLAGQIVLAGGATAAEHVQTGDFIRLRTDGLGTVNLHVEE